MSERQYTHVLPHCEVCPPLWDWPHKNLVTGTCPRCGKENANSWRWAAARRAMANRAEAKS